MWLGQRLGLPLRLPSETEWEWAARGPSAHTYTWGRQFDATFCKMRSSRAGPPRPERIASFPSDRSPYGCRDMAGGVHEWCESEFDAERGMFSLRGGSWLSSAGSYRAAARLGDQAYDRHISYGFRLALNIDAPDGATP
jgi:serine/threonine-protein kinase